MHEINVYLEQYFSRAEELARNHRMSCAELFDWIADRLIPGPAYSVDSPARIRSFVFGEMTTDGAIEGRYFHPATGAWIGKARTFIARFVRSAAPAALRQDFRGNFLNALRDLGRTTWALPDCFDETGSMVEPGFEERFESTWTHFMNGTFSVCVAGPTSAHAIANKEALQEALAALTDDGDKSVYDDVERARIMPLIDRYRRASMPFSPVDYPISSRRRLADEVMRKFAPAVPQQRPQRR